MQSTRKIILINLYNFAFFSCTIVQSNSFQFQNFVKSFKKQTRKITVAFFKNI